MDRGRPLAALSEVGGRESCTVGRQERRCPPLRVAPRRGLPHALFLLDFGGVGGGLMAFLGRCGVR